MITRFFTLNPKLITHGRPSNLAFSIPACVCFLLNSKLQRNLNNSMLRILKPGHYEGLVVCFELLDVGFEFKHVFRWILETRSWTRTTWRFWKHAKNAHANLSATTSRKPKLFPALSGCDVRVVFIRKAPKSSNYNIFKRCIICKHIWFSYMNT